MTTFKANIIPHGQLLSGPVASTEGTTHPVAYELGRCFQLDPEHCLLVASLDEQGGGDKCVGNDAFVFSSLDQIAPEKAMPLNRPDPAFPLGSGKTAWMAKYPATGAFLPLEPGQPSSGTGLMVSTGITFGADGSSMEKNSEAVREFMQLAWNGRELHVTDRTYVTSLDGVGLKGTAISSFLVEGNSFLAPFTTDRGTVVFRFEYGAGKWQYVAHGRPFGKSRSTHEALPVYSPEIEPSIQKAHGYFWIHTRGYDPVGRLYRSENGLDYEIFREQPMHTVPQVLNQRLDGNLYLATNPFPAPPEIWIRNPLVLLPLGKNGYEEATIAHDEGGIRVDTGDSIPFIDHAVASNVFLEGRRRHLLFYRVCDLKERTAYPFQTDLAKLIGTPKPRSPKSGLYLAEIEYSPGEQERSEAD
ncbi:MAG: hypothetical protein V1800_13485 [Candidatus Latescibacterota bacterium]